MTNANVWLILLTYLFLMISANDYCSVCNGKHTMCNTPNIGMNCRNPQLYELKEIEKNQIVDTHNRLRNKVAKGITVGCQGKNLPTAADMMELQWDNELAQIAERWALQCIPFESEHQHDECRTVGRFNVGQNIYGLFITSADILFGSYQDIIDIWFNQVEKFNFDRYQKYSCNESEILSLGISHFLQLVYSKVKYIGCADILFTSTASLGSEMKLEGLVKRFICNYGPGYSLNEPLYNPGHPCSKCDNGCSLDYDSLCASRKSWFQNLSVPVSNYGQNCKNNQVCLVRVDGVLGKTTTTILPKPRLKGVWKDGSCRCNTVIRSQSSKLNLSFLIVLKFNETRPYKNQFLVHTSSPRKSNFTISRFCDENKSPHVANRNQEGSKLNNLVSIAEGKHNIDSITTNRTEIELIYHSDLITTPAPPPYQKNAGVSHVKSPETLKHLQVNMSYLEHESGLKNKIAMTYDKVEENKNDQGNNKEYQEASGMNNTNISNSRRSLTEEQNDLNVIIFHDGDPCFCENDDW